MENAKAKIRVAIEQYIKLFPEEYDAFLRSVRIKEDQKSDKWATVQGTENSMLQRHLVDFPELLYNAINKMLTDSEKDWLFARGDYMKNFQGMKWFMGEFKQFKITKSF